jgi:hypothetical protein
MAAECRGGQPAVLSARRVSALPADRLPQPALLGLLPVGQLDNAALHAGPGLGDERGRRVVDGLDGEGVDTPQHGARLAQECGGVLRLRTGGEEIERAHGVAPRTVIGDNAGADPCWEQPGGRRAPRSTSPPKYRRTEKVAAGWHEPCITVPPKYMGGSPVEEMRESTRPPVRAARCSGSAGGAPHVTQPLQPTWRRSICSRCPGESARCTGDARRTAAASRRNTPSRHVSTSSSSAASATRVVSSSSTSVSVSVSVRPSSSAGVRRCSAMAAGWVAAWTRCSWRMLTVV